MMVSFDIVPLYPNVPIPETMVFLEEWLSEVPLEKAQDLLELTKLCMQQNVF